MRRGFLVLLVGFCAGLAFGKPGVRSTLSARALTVAAAGSRGIFAGASKEGGMVLRVYGARGSGFAVGLDAAGSPFIRVSGVSGSAEGGVAGKLSSPRIDFRRGAAAIMTLGLRAGERGTPPYLTRGAGKDKSDLLDR
jgi:hypothetical protein